jgi:outer membrane protein assembly factor BamD
MPKISFILSLFFILNIFIFTGCSGFKNEYNENQAEYWYQEMLHNIKTNNIEEADDNFINLETQHKNSKLLHEANILLITVHINEEEYHLANYYITKYLRLFGNSKIKDYINYLKIKSQYLAFSNPKRDQYLIRATIEIADNFIKKYPKSRYLYAVKTMKTNLHLAEYLINKEIKRIYDKLDKPKAIEYYEQNFKTDWFKENDIEMPSQSWIRQIFEY